MTALKIYAIAMYVKRYSPIRYKSKKLTIKNVKLTEFDMNIGLNISSCSRDFSRYPYMHVKKK